MYLLDIVSQQWPPDLEAEKICWVARLSMFELVMPSVDGVKALRDRDVGYKLPIVQSSQYETILFAEQFFVLDYHVAGFEGRTW